MGLATLARSTLLVSAVTLVAGCGSADVVLVPAARTQPTATTSDSPSGQPSSSSPSRSSTRVVEFSPFDRQGQLSAYLTVVLNSSGNCQVSNVSRRADVYRCFLDHAEADGSNIADPCFRNETASTPDLACPVGDALRQVVMVAPAGPLPMHGAAAQHASDSPWLMELQDGQRCLDAQGEQPLRDGQRLNYTCARGVVYGGLNRSRPRWTAAYVARAHANGRPGPIAVATAWF
jgi:hypothetical protein